MNLSSYRDVLAQRAARNVLLLGTLIRVPMFALGVVLSLHVVQTLGRSYAEAGIVVTGQMICLGISGPVRGRMLDRKGLRRVVGPCVTVNAACWCLAPWVEFWPLFGLVALAGVFTVPIFGIIRQAVIAAVADHDRRAALSLDSVATEVSFMIGPVLGVLLATVWSTAWAMFTFGAMEVMTGAILLIANPSLRTESGAEQPPTSHRREWMGVHFAAVLAIGTTATFILGGTDIAIIAAMRHYDDASGIGMVLALWGLGSMLGGIVYGAWPRSIPSGVLLVGLAVVTVPAALATGPTSLALLCALAGVMCAPTITATADELSRIVPEASRGEAMGWHGSMMTAGSAIGSPLTGVVVDRSGFAGGFVAIGVIGFVVSVVTVLLIARFRVVDASPAHVSVAA